MDAKREIGGFFGLELNPEKTEYHPNALKLNSGRYSLQYIFHTKKYKKIYLPAYTCDTVLQPVKNENLSYEFYPINELFEPNFDKTIEDDECFMYINYFGINNKNVEKIVSEYKNIIIDNTQAFFALPHKDIDTFYSAMKFFGVPDGGYLYTDTRQLIHLDKDISFDRMTYLLKRIDVSASEAYDLFLKNGEYLDNCGLRSMSKLTEAILKNIDYERCRNIRNRNFLFLHKKLSKYNELDICIDDLNGPMIYPLITKEANIKDKLIENKIYVATYWKEVKDRVNIKSFENKLVTHLVPLPIDQRYDLKDMEYIVNLIEPMVVLK